MTRTSLIHALVLPLAVSSCALDADPVDDTSIGDQEIVGGQTTTQWPAIGWVRGDSGRCSGTLIAPNVFLTAAHCELVGAHASVGFGAFTTTGGIPTTKFIQSPQWSNHPPVHDVAVFILSNPSSIDPLPIAGPGEYPSETPYNREMRATGYGIESEPPASSTVRRKTAHVRVVYTNADQIQTVGINGQTCSGDSGGPLTDLDVTKIYGVDSVGWIPCSSTAMTGYATVDRETWIDDAVSNNPPIARVASVPLWRYWNPTTIDHYYTRDRNDAGMAALGYSLDGSDSRVIPTAQPGTVPLYRFWNAATTDHFYTLNKAEGQNATGYVYERVEGYVFPRAYAGTKLLWRYWNEAGGDHFYSTVRNDAGYAAFGYVLDGSAGYVYP